MDRVQIETRMFKFRLMGYYVRQRVKVRRIASPSVLAWESLLESSGLQCPLGSKLYPTLKKVNKPYKIRREGSFVNGFR